MNLSKTLLRLCLLLLISTSLFAAEPARFPVERIEVTGGGARIQSIVIAQSLLREGQTYTEAELADAVSRIRRLPFVRAVNFSLAKGSERGLYRLVITVDPMMSLFFESEARSVISDNQMPRTLNYGRVTVGGRIPVGTSGMAHVSVNAIDEVEHMFGGDGAEVKPTFAAGYSLYRIGSRAVFADITVAIRPAQKNDRIPGSPIRFENETSVSAVAGVPIHGSQSIRAQWNSFRAPFRAELEGDEPDLRATTSTDTVELFWLRDTTDDPLYPLHGSFLKAGVVGGRGQSTFFGFDPTGPVVGENGYDTRGVETSASQYWTLSNDRAVSLHGSYYNFRTDFDQRDFGSAFASERLVVGAGFTKRFGGPNTDAWLDVRVDALRYDWRDFNDTITGRVELAHRSKWGIARLGVELRGQRN